MYSERKKIEAVSGLSAVSSTEPEDSVEQLLDRTNLSTLRFSDLEKKYIEAMYIKKWSDEIIAEKMGVKPGTVRVARKRLLDKFRDSITAKRQSTQGIMER